MPPQTCLHIFVGVDMLEIVLFYTYLTDLHYINLFLHDDFNKIHQNFMFVSETPKAIVLHDLLPTLRCLRVLDLSHIAVEEIPDMVGRLKHLRYLNLSSTQLRATLIIDRLEDVSMVSEGREANLKNKQYLRRLELKWSPGHHMPHAIGEELLECLEPHGNLKELKIDVYHGANIDTMSELESISCEFCGEGQIRGFPSLEKMKLEDMKNLKEWHEIEEGDFPRLHELTIKNSPNFASLPKFPSLCDLVLDECNEMILGSDLVSLQRFEILSCPKLVSLPEEGLSSALRYLSLCVCNSLQSLPKGLENLSSLEELSISKCPKLVTFPEEKLPSSLKLLRISAFRSLSIQRSQLLEKRCEEGGEDWNKIAHIPDRYITRF
ncbi:unnamed protein product, partial [Vitis vinifera]